jgi:hypothetical protein
MVSDARAEAETTEVLGRPGGPQFEVKHLKVEEEETPEYGRHHPEAMTNVDWSYKHIGYAAAVEELRRRREQAGKSPHDAVGQGVVVGLMDTGFTTHPALWDLDPALTPILIDDSYNFRDCQCSAYDDRLPAPFQLRQPGHGTGTGSIIASRGFEGLDGFHGVAPGVSLLTIRTLNGIILFEARAYQLARGIRHAASPLPTNQLGQDWHAVCVSHVEICRRGILGLEPDCSLVGRQAQVVSMSLGGLSSQMGQSAAKELRAALTYAEDEGMILIAAAGQGPEVGWLRALLVAILRRGSTDAVYPAKWPETIGVAASNIRALPWKAGFSGSSVDVTAPGESVWKASFDKDGAPIVRPGSGTSMAVAITAGVAAMWLDANGRDQLIEIYGKAALNSTFRYMLRTHGSRSPEELCRAAREEGWPFADTTCEGKLEEWNASRQGPGILDAGRLLRAPLPSVRQVCLHEEAQASRYSDPRPTGWQRRLFGDRCPSGCSSCPDEVPSPQTTSSL